LLERGKTRSDNAETGIPRMNERKNAMQKKLVIWLLFLVIFAASSIGMVSAQSDASIVTTITLADGGIAIDGNGAVATNSSLLITLPGTYSLSGTLSDGQIVVDVQDAGLVTLELNGVEISSTSAPIYLQQAEAAVIVLVEGTHNVLTNSAAYATEDDALNAAIFSNADLTIEGSGSLSIEAASVDGIASTASVTVQGTPTIEINAGDDAIQLETDFTITDGTLNLTAGGGMGASLSDDLSGKGIKTEGNVTIDGGSITINAADDAIRSDQDLVMNAGTLAISATGKAVHASYNLTINDGSIIISNSDEGLEGGFITINGGDINIVASDDGINISEPDDIPAPMLYYLRINGGHTIVNADGDGIDSNGSIEITDGIVIVNGPTANDNGALDYDGIFNMVGGTLIATGSAGMPAAPGESSTQYSLLINFDTLLEAGTLVRIQTADGEEILTFAPSKQFQSLVFSSPELAQNVTYEVYTGGSAEGTAVDGLYSGSAYTPGDQQASFTISSILTQIGNVRGPRMGR